MRSQTAHSCLLTADIGATKTSLALYLPEDDLLKPSAETVVSNESAAGPEALIRNFLEHATIKPVTACFGVAGPVSGNRVKMTNRDWQLDGRILQKQFGLQSVTLVNDLVATAMGAVHLPPEKLHTINPGEPNPAGAVGVIAPGTGLGEAFLVRSGAGWLPIPSEGGHSSFAPTDELQRRLLNFMAQCSSHVSTEMVCSGIGIPGLYDFLCHENDTHPRFHGNTDRTRQIIEAALAGHSGQGQDTMALQTIKLFLSILASETASLALKILATGGIFIGGGIPPRLLPLIHPDRFMDSFARGEYRDMLAAIPIHVILEPKTAIIGAAAYGRSLTGTTEKGCCEA